MGAIFEELMIRDDGEDRRMVDPIGEKLSDYKPRLRTGPKHKYPYDVWFDGGTYRLVKGKQFKVKVSSMEHLLRQQAKARGLELAVYGDGPGVIVVKAKLLEVKRVPPAVQVELDMRKKALAAINKVNPKGCRGSLKEIQDSSKRAG